MKKGMTLLEVLISLALFAFMSVYISRIFNKSLTHKRKIDKDIKEHRIISNILDVIKQDLMGVILVSDISSELRRLHPLNQAPFSAQNPVASPQPKTLLQSPVFNFVGEKNKLTFVTFSRNPAEPKEHQVIKVDYFLQNCIPPNQTQNSQCLLRGVSSYWKDVEDTSQMKTTILFENINEFQFSYYNSNKKEWEDEWNFEPIKRNIRRDPDINPLLLPSALNIKIEIESKKILKRDETFPLSHAFLRTHQTQYFSPFVHLKEDKNLNNTKKLGDEIK